MKSAVEEITRISQSLPPRKAAELLDFARSLAEKNTAKEAELDGDAEWERIINDPRPRSKLEVVRKRIEKLIREGKDEPLDLDRM
ncbi:MAG: DUF2281 domain-containing protein [Verrucomicrobiota bacterium]